MKKNTLLLSLLFASLLSQNSFASNVLTDFLKRKHGVDPVKNEVYEENCGECHFAFQPGWLPAASWNKLLSPQSLEDHFGENAEFDDEDRIDVLLFLSQNAAEHSSYRMSKKIMHSLREDKAPQRITETRYIKRKHHEVPENFVKGNKKVRLLSNCERCHTQAENGNFEEDTVVIPDVGRWIDVD